MEIPTSYAIHAVSTALDFRTVIKLRDRSVFRQSANVMRHNMLRYRALLH
jgi:hypothetical protein